MACAGSGYACHAQVVSFPKNLGVKIPDGLNFEEAVFVTLGEESHSILPASLRYS